MKRALLCVVVSGVASAAASANLIPNAGFENVGPLGALVVTNSGGGGPSAAADWNTFRPIESPITTEILDSTDPLAGGGGKMLRLTTTTGFGGSSANGVFCNLLAPIGPGGVASIDMLVEKGVAFTLGFVGISGGFESQLNEVGSGIWQHYELVVAGGPVGSFGIEINSGNGGTVLLDNAFAVPAPGAATLLAAAGLLARRNRGRYSPV